jgi:crotonobetainyl-CoA:carnitine CoA-transferase CaiB-like acyl-CoA transferase
MFGDGNQDSSGSPLDGVTVLAAEQMISLPYATQLLARLGATVVKVEPPGGEAGRGATPAFVDEDGSTTGATFARANFDKSSIVLDLNQAEGQSIFRKLAAHFDVIAENMRPGVMDRLGLGYEAISKAAPRAVYLSVSGFGNLGSSPYREWPAYGPVVESMAGIYEMSREPGVRLRTNTVGSLGDIGAAIFAVVGVLAALRRRDRTGLGEYVDISMLDSMIAINDMFPQMWSLGSATKDRRSGVLGSFAASDGDFVVAALREHQLHRLARLLGREDWLTNPELASRRDWYVRTDDLIRPSIEEWASHRTKFEAAREFAMNGVPAGPSQTMEDLVQDEHVQRHGMFMSVKGADREMLIAEHPIKMAHSGGRPPRKFPKVGVDTEEVLRKFLDLDDEEIARLRAAGVI